MNSGKYRWLDCNNTVVWRFFNNRRGQSGPQVFSMGRGCGKFRAVAKGLVSFLVSGLIILANRGSAELPGERPCSLSNIFGPQPKSQNGLDTENPRRSPTSYPPLSRRQPERFNLETKIQQLLQVMRAGKCDVGLEQPRFEIFFRALLAEKQAASGTMSLRRRRIWLATLKSSSAFLTHSRDAGFI